MKGVMLMSKRKIAWLVVVVSVIVCLGSFGLANAFQSHYSNKVPYGALFGVKSSTIMVQQSDKGKVVQAVVPVNQEEEQVEPQTIKKSKGD
jgi:hypothetical protein